MVMRTEHEQLEHEQLEHELDNELEQHPKQLLIHNAQSPIQVHALDSASYQQFLTDYINDSAGISGLLQPQTTTTTAQRLTNSNYMTNRGTAGTPTSIDAVGHGAAIERNYYSDTDHQLKLSHHPHPPSRPDSMDFIQNNKNNIDMNNDMMNTDININDDYFGGKDFQDLIDDIDLDIHEPTSGLSPALSLTQHHLQPPTVKQDNMNQYDPALEFLSAQHIPDSPNSPDLNADINFGPGELSLLGIDHHSHHDVHDRLHELHFHDDGDEDDHSTDDTRTHMSRVDPSDYSNEVLPSRLPQQHQQHRHDDGDEQYDDAYDNGNEQYDDVYDDGLPRVEGITDLDLSELERDLFGGSTVDDGLDLPLDELPSGITAGQSVGDQHEFAGMANLGGLAKHRVNTHEWNRDSQHSSSTNVYPAVDDRGNLLRTSVGSNHSSRFSHSLEQSEIQPLRSYPGVGLTRTTITPSHPQSHYAVSHPISSAANINNQHRKAPQTQTPSVSIPDADTPFRPSLKPVHSGSHANDHGFSSPRMDSCSQQKYLESYSTTPAAAASRNLHDMLFDARDESQSLRALNERLLQANNQHLQKIADLELDRERSVNMATMQAEEQIKRVQNYETQKHSTLQDQITQLTKDLTAAKSSLTQINQIKASLHREKELEVLTIKKELLAHTERHLQDIRSEMASQREDIAAKYQKDLAVEMNRCEARVAEIQARADAATADCDVLRDKLSKTDVEMRVLSEKSLLVDKLDKRQMRAKEKLGVYRNAIEQIWVLLDGPSDGSLRISSGSAGSRQSVQSRHSGNTVPSPIEVSQSPSCAQVISACREVMERHEMMVAGLRADVSVKTEQMQSITDTFTMRIRDEQRRLETQHRQALESLQRTHQADLAHTKVSMEASMSMALSDADHTRARLEATVQNLTRRLEESRAIQKTNDLVTNVGVSNAQITTAAAAAADEAVSLTDLAARFPAQLSRYRSELELQITRHRDALHSIAVAEKVNRVAAENAQTLQRLSKQHEQEKQAIEEHHRADIINVSTRLKDQCSAAYGTAISKLKAEYLRLEGLLMKRFTDEKEIYVDFMEKKSLKDIERAIETTRKEVTDVMSGEYRAKIAQLEHSLGDARTQSLSELRSIKEKYLATVCRMRDELATRKQDGWKRLEKEWVKRRRIMNDEWLRR
ncbi:hypothetical protein BASA83_009531 [Batrachochytrium salamandrivorans]|nr:hypothetical protein BASA83_009531 [Batrachochytrium salamandrivorans]